MNKICFLDTETTSLRSDREIWEIAALLVDEDGTIYTESDFVRVSLSDADPFALDVGRFYDRHPQGIDLKNGDVSSNGNRGLISPNEMAEKYFKLTYEAHIVGMVPNFDTERLGYYIENHLNIRPKWHHHLIDVETLAWGYLIHAGAKDVDPTGLTLPYSMSQMANQLKVPPPTEEERHTALGDVLWTTRIWDAIHDKP